jgi:hypothetical protein
MEVAVVLNDLGTYTGMKVKLSNGTCIFSTR